MIKKITIKNFKCFKNETVLDLKKTNYKLLEQNTCGKLLKGLLFVGENASGKTSAILPLKLLLDLLFKDQEVEFVLYFKTFKIFDCNFFNHHPSPNHFFTVYADYAVIYLRFYYMALVYLHQLFFIRSNLMTQKASYRIPCGPSMFGYRKR